MRLHNNAISNHAPLSYPAGVVLPANCPMTKSDFETLSGEYLIFPYHHVTNINQQLRDAKLWLKHLDFRRWYTLMLTKDENKY
jgi:hypothetical protein